MKRYIRSADDINSTELFRTISRIVIVDDASTFLDGTNSQDEIFMNYSKSAIRRLSEDEISRIFSAVALARIYEIQEVLNTLFFVSEDEPGLIDEITEYIKNARQERK